MKAIYIILFIVLLLVSGIFGFTRTNGWKLDYGKSAAVTTTAEFDQLQPSLEGKRITVSGTITAIGASDDSLVLDDKVTVKFHPRATAMIKDAKAGSSVKVAGILKRENGELILNPSGLLSED